MINLNKAFEDEKYFEYLKDPDSVSKEWQEHFQKIHGKSVLPLDAQYTHSSETPTSIKSEDLKLEDWEELVAIEGIQSKIVSNMEDSVQVPSATSVRTIPVKALDENRRIINKYLKKVKRPKVSFTNILLWALVKALTKFPHMNDTFTRVDGKPYRIKRKTINVGLAIDVTKDDGSRLLIVPNVKNAQDLHFSEFITKFEEIIQKTRANNLAIEDLHGTTVTLTNPGMIGTSASSPRLMSNQGLILATGSIDYPAEFQAVRPEMLTSLAVSKVVTMTNTYDHRITQGAQSAEFLNFIHKLLIGKYQFYDQIFASLKIPFEPLKWETDNTLPRHNYLEKDDLTEKNAHVMQLINAYRVRGHLLSSINPLGHQTYYYPELDPAYYGFNIWDLDRVFHCDDNWVSNNLPLRDIIEILRDTYCGYIGVEFMHIQDPERKNWIKQNLEFPESKRTFTKSEKLKIYKKLIEAEAFEDFLHTKFLGHKRFSLEGNETLIVFIDKLFEDAANANLNSIVIGMAHRGRLNVLVNNIGKGKEIVFNEFDGKIDPTYYQGSGDVKYHLGDNGTYESEAGNSVEVILSPNPSHLELVNPVIEGMARALTNEKEDPTHRNVLPLLVHGDSAFAGQGIVAETLNLSELEGYKTGGTVHVIVNNQIGFTTNVEASRSSVYATDIAKMIQCPIIHVNGNVPEAVTQAAEFALAYRNKFHSDIIVDLIGYRKYGHNEADEPSYTQPLLYKKIKKMIPVRKLYEEELIRDNEITLDESKAMIKEQIKNLNDKFSSRNESSQAQDFLTDDKFGQTFRKIKTAISEDDLQIIAKTITSYPPHININPKVVSGLKHRAKMMASDKPAIDWSLAEALALGSILMNGNSIRFSGEDSRRGTFSQRHSVIIDIKTEDDYIPLNHIQDKQAELQIYDSPLSELAVLGFDWGYSIKKEKSLTLWEAQFGDFANMAQGIIDQFIACSEVKWGVRSNLVMLLPHGYDGQGAEHSSARLERYLQLCADENLIVANLTTPAQYFHALRRQTKLKYKMPMILMTPKSMLRNPLAVSSIDDLAAGGFQNIIDDPDANPKDIDRLLFCSGKLYYELLTEKKKQNLTNVAIVRIEQLYPFDSKLIGKILRRYAIATKVAFVQEEPQNMGAWSFIAPEIYPLLSSGQNLSYVGRRASAATATGSYKRHLREQAEVVSNALMGEI